MDQTLPPRWQRWRVDLPPHVIAIAIREEHNKKNDPGNSRGNNDYSADKDNLPNPERKGKEGVKCHKVFRRFPGNFFSNVTSVPRIRELGSGGQFT